MVRWILRIDGEGGFCRGGRWRGGSVGIGEVGGWVGGDYLIMLLGEVLVL